MRMFPTRTALATTCSLALAVFCARDSQQTSDAPPRVRIDGGMLEGSYLGADSALSVFKGIPFAAPPVGALRWKPPEAVAPWAGVRKATAFGPACSQTRYPIDWFDRITKRVGGHAPPEVIPSFSEDCLYLSVWTGNLRGSRARPVMVWVHGGGDVDGWATHGSMNGEQLARNGAVVVMIEYRLGALGFLADSALSAESPHHVSGNYGLLDQIAALQWVQRNIAAFGGDPTRVTIFGQSAGAVNVTCLMMSPLAKGLFHRVIAQSGACTGPLPELRRPVMGFTPLAAVEASGKALARKLGVDRAPDVLAVMRATSADSIIAATADNADNGELTVDGWVIPSQPDVALAQGEQADVPLLIGSNEDEMRSLARAMPVKRMQDYPNQLLGALGENPRFRTLIPQMLAAYPATDTATGQRRLFEASSDWAGLGARYMARAMRNRGEHNVYVYRFTHVLPSPGGREMGAFHGAETPFVFGNDMGYPKGDRDDALGDAIRGYWLNFAATGDPNGKGLPEWPAYDISRDSYLELGDTIRSREHLRTKQFDLYDSAQARLDERLQSVAKSAVVR
jgi:para-nitrobenzyl esterase